MPGQAITDFWLKYSQKIENPYLTNSMKKAGAINAVNRILKFGRTETGEKLQVTKWFKQQLRLTADNRLRHVLTTGASQISKSLGNYLVAIDDLINGQINIGWIYASRQSMINQQPTQFQQMIAFWMSRQKDEYDIKRESIGRYSVKNATANFSYANSSSEQLSGGSAEGREQNSFQASKLYQEEKSSWKSNIDVSPRLGASKLISKPIRELGTPGSGTGIERLIRDASHNFEPGVYCKHCGELSWLHPLGNLLKPKVTLEKNSGSKVSNYFNLRGEIHDYFKDDDDRPYIACNVCQQDITEQIGECELYSRQSLQSADEWLDSLSEDEIYYPSVSIYLSPLLKVPDDPYRVVDLVREGLNPESVLIYHQNKLGIESKFTITGVTAEDYDRVLRLRPYVLRNPLRFVGIDQGTEYHYLTCIDFDPFTYEKNITDVITIAEDEIVPYLIRKRVTQAIIDNEPGRLSANGLAKASKGILVLGDQRDILDDLRPIKVSHGSIEIDAYAVNNTIFKEEILSGFFNNIYRINCTPHKKFKKHITVVKRDLASGDFQRPKDHDDDFFFSLMFAEAAIMLYMKYLKKPGTSYTVGVPLAKLKGFK
jgi:rRNA maturation protein Rpf1